jgi:hypothetical protein
MAANQPFTMPESTRLTIMLFPPYGLAWLWLNKDLDKEKKVFGSVGMSLYLGVWLVLVGFVLYFFTPLGAGEDLWKTEDTYNRGDMLENIQRKQKIKELEKQLQDLKKQGVSVPQSADGFYVASHGAGAWTAA